MKKFGLLMLAAACCLALATSCKDDDDNSVLMDYIASTSYMIDNQTDKAITVVVVHHRETVNGKINESSNRLSILPGEEKRVIFEDIEMCGKNTTIHEYKSDPLPILILNAAVEVYANDRLLKETLLNRKNWVFSAKKYYSATYLLTITDKLIDSVGYVAE